MPRATDEIGGLEVWRGGVNTWECDANGHLNIRFYVARAMEGLPALAAAMGLPRAFSPAAASTLLVRETHVRFVREARANEALHIVAGVLAMDETEATLLFVVIHSATGEIAAAVTARVVHVTPRDGFEFPWSRHIRDRAGALGMTVPGRAGPRSLTPGPAELTGDPARARGLGLRRIAAGSVSPADCDVFGRQRPEMVLGRISDGFAQFAAATRPMWAAMSAPSAEKPGGKDGGAGGAELSAAAVEMRLLFAEAPRAGDRVELWSGLQRADTRTMTIVHWLLDPETGRPWAAAEHLIVTFDLKARKMVTLSQEIAAAIQGAAIKGLTV